ncbi:hypothetical protein COCNU_09G004820 [Cocos nucifera]|uniref:Ornithine decarboxylase n=1 Tax=Cocos nucifera TaxID=13894 RepID=A0A8K0IKG2_COCNU|nr:hypothetical protein COCNU_09G004820 [Cocos nucifera]
MAALGSDFDCARRGEIESVLAIGVSPDRIIYANPCKAESHIKYAANVGVNLTTFDCGEEIDKIRRWHPKCELLIRLKAPDDGEARCPLGPKYGALPEEVVPLLQAANDAQLAVVGVSFHVGSGVTRSQVFQGAIAAAKAVFNAADQLGMPHMQIFDIGGGVSQQVHSLKKLQGKKRYPSTVFGPTYDAFDTVLTGHQLPELHVNDWLVFPNMGAYTASAGSNFNGFATSAICTYLAYSNPFQHE